MIFSCLLPHSQLDCTTTKKYSVRVFQLYNLILYTISTNLFISIFRSDIIQCYFCGSVGILDVFFSIWRCAYYLKKSPFALGRLQKFRCSPFQKKLKYKQVHDIMHTYIFALTVLEHFAQNTNNETDSFCHPHYSPMTNYAKVAY